MKKTIILVLGVALAVPFFASAEMLPGGDAMLRAKIAELLTQVAVLQKELEAAKSIGVKEDGENIAQVFRFIKTLEKGTRSDEVKTMQSLLAKDSEVYPEGFVTGYYGKLTVAAVKRFQNKHPKSALTVESLTVPRISDIAATTTKTTMTITWKTDMPTSAKIWWGSPGPLDTVRMTPVDIAAFSEDHRAVFSGIIYASTTYAFIIAVSDKDGNTSTTTEQIYVTL